MGNPNIFTAIVNDSVLMQVMVSGSGTRRGSEELREVFDLFSEGAWDNEGRTWGWDSVNRSFSNGRGKVLNGDVGEGDTVKVQWP